MSKSKGEIAELGSQLQTLQTSGKRSIAELKAAKRECFRKIISLVSLGMDMSSLFPSMISTANLSKDDLVLKKMLFLYITHYATQVPDIALLAINQLHKDCQDQDPTVRGLALRSLCSLRVPNFVEYVVSPVTSGLDDRHPYVRRTAVMGVLKIFHIDPLVVHAQGMLEKVRAMLHLDADPQVLANCLSVLMQADDVAPLAQDTALIYALTNRIKDFSDWSQCQVLELVAMYKPKHEGEVFEFLNTLEDRMSHANSAVVISTIKAFLHLTLNMTATHQQVLERIKDPLKNLLSREEPSTMYAVLSHVLLLLQRAPVIFEQEYMSFYCRAHDPWYIKKLKMESLSAIASSSNVYEIVNELTEYTRDISPAIGREAVRAVGRIALTVSDVGGVIERLVMFLDSGGEHLTAETLVQLKDVLRRYPDVVMACLTQLNDLTPSTIEQPEARAALAWIMGQFGQHLPSAPYLLEQMAEGVASEPPSVRLALLTAACQLFFKRPPECKPLLGALLSACLSDPDQDVRDRALLYYRLLKADVGEAERIISPPLLEVQAFSDDLTDEARDAVFREFNSLSVIFRAPASTFVEQWGYHGSSDASGAPGAGPSTPPPSAVADLLGDVDATDFLLGGVTDDDGAAAAGATASSSSLAGGALLDLDLDGGGGGGLLDLSDLLGDGGGGGVGACAAQPPPRTPAHGGGGGGSGGLLDLEDLLGGGGVGGGVGARPSAAEAHPHAASIELRLEPAACVSSPAFQDAWRSLTPVHTYSERLSQQTVAAFAANGHRDFTQHMAQAYIMTIASGGAPPAFKYYFYGQVASTGALMMVEMCVRTDSCQADYVIKTSATELLPQFIELWSNCLMGFAL
ncbi:hypothetical protein FOA52_004482 [Chlamydomonas sp. UWO 241]|nr:hypothetical protein FOA52_004482 [Chlamydomonas sp. UWO 241]